MLHDDNNADKKQIPVIALAGSFLAFALLGTVQAIYGPLIPDYLNDFTITPSTAGTVLTSHFLGALLGVLVFYQLRRLHNPHHSLVIASTWLMGIGCIAITFAPTWNLLIAAAFLAGLGFGGIDFGLNQYFAEFYSGGRSVAMLNLLNGCFGVGSMVGPIIALIARGSHFVSFAFISAVTLLSAVLIVRLPALMNSVNNPADQASPALQTPKRQHTKGASTVILGAFLVIYVLHVGIETGVGGWEQLHLELTGMSDTAAYYWVSAYWLAMTISRFAIVPIAAYASDRTIVAVCMVGMTASLGTASIPALAPFAYFAVGLFIGPIFPTCIPWLIRLLPHIDSATAYVIALSMLGGVAFPPLLGTVISPETVWKLPLVLTLLSIFCLGAFLTITQYEKRLGV